MKMYKKSALKRPFENLRNRNGKAVFSELQRLKTAFVSSFMACYLAICVKLHAHLHHFSVQNEAKRRLK